MAQAWLSRPVFLTSTFRDFHAERDHLRSHVFPELEERLRERFHHLEWVDLRWGVETAADREQEARELLVLKVCLGEIERCRPFLVGLLGDRYGWVPPPERMERAADEAGFRTDVAGKSVTALEIEYGVLDRPDQERRSHFYLREPLPYDRMPPDKAAVYSDRYSREPGAADAARRLDALKSRIERQLPDRAHRYRAQWDYKSQRVAGLEQWGRQVLEHLWQDLKDETEQFQSAPAASWQEQERQVLDQFIEDESRDFVGREDLVRDLSALALDARSPDGEKGVVVTGASGTGKSALFAKLCRELQRDDVLLLAHAAGISTRANQVDSLLVRWIGELAAHLKTRDPSEGVADREQLGKAFASLLARAAQNKRVVCLLDALNQVERTPAGRYVTWLPRPWPENARLLATAVPGTESQSLGQLPGIRVLDLPRLTARDAEQMAVTICSRYHKTPEPDVITALAGKKLPDGTSAAGVPLWLDLALEELLLLDEEDFTRAEKQYAGTPAEKLHALLLDIARDLPAEVESLYGYLLKRQEDVHGRELVQAFASLITLSRTGWRETDFRALLPKPTDKDWSEMRFAALRRGYRAHLKQRGALGQWDFFHVQMRQAVNRCYLADPAEARRLHTTIADHLGLLPPNDPLRQSELMYHLIRTDDALRAAKYYISDLNPAELDWATKALADKVREDGGAVDIMQSPVVSLLRQAMWRPGEAAALCRRYTYSLSVALRGVVPLSVRLSLQSQTCAAISALVQQEPGNLEWQHLQALGLEQIGDLHLAEGHVDAADRAFAVLLQIRERLVSADLDNLALQHELGIAHERVGRVRQLKGDLRGALAAFRQKAEITAGVAAKDPRNTLWQYEQAISQERIGTVLLDIGEAQGALEALRSRHAIIHRLADGSPSSTRLRRDLLVSHLKIANVLMLQHRTNDALRNGVEALEIARALASADPGDADRNSDLAACHEMIGSACVAQRRLVEARQHCRDGLVIREGLAAADPGNAELQRNLAGGQSSLGDVHAAWSSWPEALTAYRSSVAVLEPIVRLDPTRKEWQCALAAAHCRVGAVQQAAQDFPHAKESYRACQTIVRVLDVACPHDASVKRALLDVYYQQATLHAQLGEGEDARRYWQLCRKTLREMRAAGMYTPPGFGELLQSLEGL